MYKDSRKDMHAVCWLLQLGGAMADYCLTDARMHTISDEFSFDEAATLFEKG